MSRCIDCDLEIQGHATLEGVVFCPAGTVPSQGEGLVVGDRHWRELKNATAIPFGFKPDWLDRKGDLIDRI